VEGDKRTEHTEPRRDFPDAPVDPAEARSHRILNGPESKIDLLQAYAAGDAD
jgi:hypothetical protein